MVLRFVVAIPLGITLTGDFTMQIINTLIATLITVSLLFFAQPKTPAYASGADQLVLLICNNIKGDDKYRLRKLLKENRLKVKKIYGAVKCNGLTMVRYAIKSNASKVGVFIVKRVPGSQIASAGDIEWAKENGFGDHEITAEMINRISD